MASEEFPAVLEWYRENLHKPIKPYKPWRREGPDDDLKHSYACGISDGESRVIEFFTNGEKNER